jgi:hypothetical protein
MDSRSNPRQALVIGNAEYNPSPPLTNPCNDANAIATKLKALGFEVILATNQTHEQFDQIYPDFLQTVGNAHGEHPTESVVLFYFAGHGLQVKGENYLLPINARIQSEMDLRRQTIHLNTVLNDLGPAAKTTIAILDCCRDNPLPRGLNGTRSLGASRGLAPLQTQTSGAFIAFATAPDSVAEDGRGYNSPFTGSLVEYIDKPFDSISSMMLQVRRKVFEETKGRQIPWEHTWLLDAFTFQGKAAVGQPGPTAEQRENNDWELVKESENPDLVRGFLRQYPNTAHRHAATEKLEQLLRHKWAQKLLATAGSALVGIAVLFLCYVGVKWMSLEQIPDHDLVGGDIYLDLPTTLAVGERETSLNQCKWRCLIDIRCKGFNHEHDRENNRFTCYLKHEARYLLQNQNPQKSSMVSYMSSWFEKPVQSPFYMYWDNFLEGTHINPKTLLAYTSKPQDSEKYFRVANKLDCMTTCHRLGQMCKGFTFVAVTGQCALFSDIRQPVLYENRECMAAPGTYSGVVESVKEAIHAKGIRCPSELPVQ